MSDEVDDGGPAFPVLERLDDTTYQKRDFIAISTEGMSVRDYIAAHAPISFGDAVKYGENPDEPSKSYAQLMRFLAQMRYHYAGEMLKARKAGKP